MIVEIGLYERHFNQMQSTYRTLASTWLLGLFAAAGFLLGKEGAELPLDPSAVLALLGVLAAVGITLLWLLDLRVYAALLRTYFDAGVELESQHPWLPAVRTTMLRERLSPGPKVARYYTAGATACLVVSSIGALGALGSPAVRLLVAGGYVLAGAAVVIGFGTMSGRARRQSQR
ncbi:hypothetical protein ACI780_10870 [Geodermatophilus sp. SYSU D00814]